MGLVERDQLWAALSPPIDNLLATQLLDEFISIERRYIQRDWEPATLDGGQFCEILGRIIYQQDSGAFSATKGLDDCAKYIANDQVTHAVLPRHDAIHLMRVLQTIYKFRSQRGAVHISPSYSPNHMDARMVVENVRWAMNECLRVFWQGDRELVAKAIRELLQFDVPCIGRFEEVVLVQRTDLSPEEEVILLLHFGGETGLSRNQLGIYAMCSPSSITRAVQSLTHSNCRQAIQLPSGNYRLTDLGSRRIRMQLTDKLVAQ